MKLFDSKKIGINISDQSIELVELSFVGDNGEISNYKKYQIDKGIVESGYIKNKKKLKELMFDIFSSGENGKFGNEKLIFGIQEENIYSHLIEVDSLDNLEKNIQEKTNSLLAKNVDNYFISYKAVHGIQIVSDEQKIGKYFYVSAVEKKYIAEWDSFFKKIGHEIDYFESMMLALGRLINNKEENVLLLDIDCRRASFSVFLNNQIFYSYEIILNEENDFNIDSLEIEKINLSAKNENASRCRELLCPIVEEIEQSISYIERKTKRKINKIILSGCASNIKNILSYFKKEINEDSLSIESFSSHFKEKKVETSLLSAYALANGKFDKNNVFFKNEKNLLSSTGINFLKRNMLKGVILLVIIVSLAFLAFYFLASKDKPIEKIQDIPKYTNSDTYSYNVFLSTDKIVRPDEVKGRIFRINYETPLSVEEIIKNAKSKLDKEIKEGEFYWEENVGDDLNSESLIFPLETKWFIGNKKDLDKIINNKFYSKLNGYSDYKVNIIKGKPIKKTEFEDLYKTKIEVFVKSNIDLEKFNLKENIKERALIVNTNGKTINIRKGPGTNFPIVAKAVEGESYSFVRELGDWTNLELSDGSLVWIFSNFVKVDN